MSLEYFDLVIAFDTEYVGGKNFDGVPYDENAVISYQAAFLHPRTGRKGSGLVLTSGPNKRRRRRLDTILSNVVGAVARQHGIDIHHDLTEEMRGVPPRRQRKLRFALAAHFSRADLAGFADFKQLRTSFDGVRGTFASVKRPTVRELRMPNGARIPVGLTLYDTKLLAPAGAGSLMALGNLLGRSKLTLPGVVDERGQAVRGIRTHGPRPCAASRRIRGLCPPRSRDHGGLSRRVAEFADSWGLESRRPRPPAWRSSGCG